MSLDFGNFLNQRAIFKIAINVGALLDIPTAEFPVGKKGETIINGGLSQFTGIVGQPNRYKSGLCHYLMLSASNKIFSSLDTRILTYDTEVTAGLDRLERLAQSFEYIPDNPILSHNPVWCVVDKTGMAGNKWIMEFHKYNQNKLSEKKITFDCFINPYTNSTLEVYPPTFVEIDSLTSLTSETTEDATSEDLDSSKTNMLFMKDNLIKSKFIQQIPAMIGKSNTYLLATGQLREEFDLAGPYAPKKSNDLQYLKGNLRIKGASGDFNYLTNQTWHAVSFTELKNQTTKGPEYPLYDDNSEPDLHVLKTTTLRSKSGMSGVLLPIVCSQSEGVLPSLTEFHYIKENGKYGIEGSNTSYNIIFYPDVKLSRTTVRRKLNEDSLLRRAVNIAAELLQMNTFHPKLNNLLCSPKELYEDIKALGYDWNVLLNTRGYWLPDQYNPNFLPFLSIMDLLKIRKGLYKPYWLKE